MSTLFVNTIKPNSGDTVTLSGSLTTTGKLTIGDETGDTLAITAEVSSSIIPDATATYDLGTMDKAWRNLHAHGLGHIHTASIGVVSSSLLPDAGATYALGTMAQSWGSAHIHGLAHIHTASIDVVSSSLLPLLPNCDLGATGSQGWRDLYIDGLATISSANIIRVSSSLIPSQNGDDQYNLGSVPLPWDNIYLTGSIVGGTNQILEGSGSIFGAGLSQSDKHQFTGSVSISGSITATSVIGLNSGIISSSAQLPSGIISSSTQLSTLSNVLFTGGITASGGITSSGTVTMATASIVHHMVLGGGIFTSASLQQVNSISTLSSISQLNSSGSALQLQINSLANATSSYASISQSNQFGSGSQPSAVQHEFTGSVFVTGSISSSGNIQSAGTISASSFEANNFLGTTFIGNNFTGTASFASTASNVNLPIGTAASLDLNSSANYTVNGSKVEVKAITDTELADGTFATFNILNSEIATNSVIYGAFTGVHSNTNMSSSIISVATIAARTASVFIHNETGGAIAADTPFTASFVIL